MLKIDENVRDKKKEAFSWAMAVCSLIGTILIVCSGIFDKLELIYYGMAFMWVNCLMVFLQKTVGSRHTAGQKKLLEDDQILKIQMKAKSSSFDFMINLYIIINFICNLVIAVSGLDGIFYKSQFFTGAYCSAAIFLVIMVGIKAYYVVKYKKHIYD